MAGSAPLPERLARFARRRTPTSRRARGVLLVIAGVVTVGAAVLAVDRLDLTLDRLRPGWLVLAALLATPVTIALNAAELRATAAASGADPAQVGWPRATRTVVLATAANLLPVPAGAALRVQVLHTAGARLASAAGVQVAAAALWVGLSLVLAGGALVTTELIDTAGVAGVPVTVAGWLALVGGVVLVGAGVLLVGRTATTRPLAAAGWLSLVELGTALVQAARLWLVLLGLGVAATATQALVIGTASPVAAAAGFFPGGIGLAELLSAVVAPLSGLDPAAGLLAVAVARLLGLAVTVPVALTMGLADLVRRPPEVHG